MNKKDIHNLEKENIMLSGELLKIANQLEEWASQSLRGGRGGCPQHQVKTMIEMATNIRRKVIGIKFFRKENEDD